MKKNKQQKNGFTLLEVVIALTLFSVVIIIAGSTYTLSQRVYRKNSSSAELAQNARVCLDRMSRELRQSVNIITPLPPTSNDVNDPAPAEIFFQDGHEEEKITYIQYYLSDGQLKRTHKAYYFSGSPDIYVLYNSKDSYGNPPSENILEDQIVGEYFDSLKFWGSGGLVKIEANFLKNNEKYPVLTSVFQRN